MKMYMVSIINAAEVRKVVFINAFNRFTGLCVNRSCHGKLGVDRARVDYDDWDMAPRIMRERIITDLADLKVAAMAYAEAVADHHDVATTSTVEEVNGDLLKWFMTWGLPFTYRMYSVLCDTLSWGSTKREKMRGIISDMEERFSRLHGNPVQWRISYKGATYRSEYGFKSAKNFCTEMGRLIAESIKEDEDVFSASFMEDYSTESGLHHRIAQAAHDALHSHGINFNLTDYYCDHWDHTGNGSTVLISGGRYREYCSHCAQNTDVVIETYDTGVLMERGAAYWHDGNEEYYQHEPDSDYDDENSDDDRDNDTSSLMSYTANVLDVLDKDASFTSSPFGEFHMGVEVELVTSGYVSEAVTDLRTQLGEDYVICKSDGSLPSGGVEVVTAPRGLHDHIARFKAWTIDSKYRAWNTNKCGMHVHIDSRAFTRLTLGKFIMFINDEKNAEFVRKIAGRHPHIDEQARTYCAAEGQYAMENPSKALKGKSSSRYYMVNTTCLRSSEANRLGVSYVGERNFNTIELRVFRASLKKERLLAQIEFTHAVIMFCRVASMRDLNGASFLKWLKSTDNRYPHLSDWYGIRRRVGAKNAAPSESTCVDNLTVSS